MTPDQSQARRDIDRWMNQRLHTLLTDATERYIIADIPGREAVASIVAALIAKAADIAAFIGTDPETAGEFFTLAVRLSQKKAPLKKKETPQK